MFYVAPGAQALTLTNTDRGVGRCLVMETVDQVSVCLTPAPPPPTHPPFAWRNVHNCAESRQKVSVIINPS